MKQGHEKGSAFAICTVAFQRAHKPIYVGESQTELLRLLSESIRIEGNRVSGVAIHPKRIFHPEEGVTHVYLREELAKAAPTLIGKPFGIDHRYVLPPPNLVTKAWYDEKEEGIAFEGVVDDKIAGQIRNRAFKGLSIELDWFRPGGKIEYANGVAPRNFELTSVHLLRQLPAGDKDAYIKLWSHVKEQLAMGPPLPLDRRVEALEKQTQDLQNQINILNAKLEVLTGSQKQGGADQPKPQQTPETGKLQGVESPQTSENQDAVALRKQVFDLEAQLAQSEKTMRALQKKQTDFRRRVEAVIPQPSIWGAWRPGSKLMVQQLQRALHETSDSEIHSHESNHDGSR